VKIRADDLSVSSLFNRNDLVFNVPVYQRPYSWGQQQWEDLWDDVLESYDDGVHFIGSVVAINQGAVAKGFNSLEIVDGQQRLTTLSIVFCALRDYYKSIGENDAAESINRSYLNSHTFKDQTKKLFLGRVDNKFYEDLLSGKLKENNNIKSAYDFFFTRIDEYGKEDDVTDKFTNKVSLVLITAENPEDAFKLFETLNDRGLDLSAVDLIKNFFLSETAKKIPDDLDSVIEYWDQIVTNLKEIDKIRFFRQFLLANYPGKVTRQALYPAYKIRLSKSKDLSDFILDLVEASDLYRKINKQAFDNDNLNEKLEDFLNLKATTSFTLILKLLIVGWDYDSILSIIPAIESFSLRRAVCGWSTAEMDTIYNQIANWDSGLLSIEEIRNYLSEKSPSDDEFKRKFIERDFRQDSQTKYVIEQFEYARVATREKKISGRKDVHIEHIMPIRIHTKKCKNDHGGDWAKYLGQNAEKHGDFFQKIGNLTLLAAELNVPASNNPFESKKSFYEKSEMKITRDLCGYSDWRINEIEKRTNHLAELALQIWKI